MANNPYVNRVDYAGGTLIDISNDTVTAASVLSGVTFHLPSGASGTGSIVSQTASGTTTLNASTTSKSYSAGYYANAHGCNVTVYDGSVT